MGIAIKKRILCVDASQDNCELLSFILSKAGYESESAHSVIDGLQMARRGEFALHLVELSFPDGNGFELIEKMREFAPSTPVVVCSGNVRQSAQKEALRVGAQMFLAKPTDLDLLMRTIVEILQAEERLSQGK
jgi:CheY-like chemotaxis protein